MAQQQNVTVGEFVAEAEVVINQLEPTFEYNRADLFGFVRAAWPYDGTPADAACEFCNEVKKQREDQ